MESRDRRQSLLSLSPASGMWAATYTKPATVGSVPASVITDSPITVSYENAWSILLRKDALRSCDIFLERRQRLLHDTDVIPMFDKNVVDAFPARTICPGTVNQNNIPNATLFVRP